MFIQRRHHSPFLMIVSLGAFLCLVPGSLAFQAGQDTSASQPEQPAADLSQPPPNLEEVWGIQAVSLRQTAHGHLLDFRYRVLDPQKAATLLRRQNKPYLIDEATGNKLPVPSMPKIGALRQSALTPEAGKVYFVMFQNPNGFVKSGSKVTVVIGNFKAEHLVVD
jgi:hypothetical protein